MTPLFERFRPRTWGDVVGQDAAVKLLQGRAQRGELGGCAYWIVGGTGTGKTTLARLAADALADPLCCTEIDAQDVNRDAAALLRDAERTMHLWGWGPSGRTGRAWIVNECHGLSALAVRRLKTILEPAGGIPNHVAWFFTTTNDDQELLFDGAESAKPMIARCKLIQLARRDLCGPFARRLQACLLEAGLDGHWPAERYERIVKESGNSLRAAFDRAETLLEG